MKYILNPFWILLILIFTIFEIVFCLIILLFSLIWHFKQLKTFDELWEEMHTNMIGFSYNGDVINGWDENINETIIRRITNCEYKHIG